MRPPDCGPDNPFCKDYPAPPGAHWAILLIFWIAIIIPSRCYFPNALSLLVARTVFSLWPLYLCLWLLRLNSESKALYWVFASVVIKLVQIASLVLHIFPMAQIAFRISIDIADLAIPIVAIFVIRSELQKHYNEREPFGLELDPWLTLVFAYFYFQFHLRDIAYFKKRQGEAATEMSTSQIES